MPWHESQHVPPLLRRFGSIPIHGTMTEVLKLGVAVLSLMVLLRWGLLRRAGSVLRAILSRFAVLVVALLAVTFPSSTGSQAAESVLERTAAAEGACSKVIPVDAMAEVVMGTGTGALGAFTVGTGASLTAPVAVGAGTAAPAAAVAGGSVVGSVALAAGVFLGSVYGTCKFIDWIVGDHAAVDTSTLFTWSNTGITTGPCSQVLMDQFGSTVGTAATDVCTKLILPSSLPSPWTFAANGNNGQCPITRAGVTIPCDRANVGELVHLYGTGAGGTGSGEASAITWLNATRNGWCGQTTTVVGNACYSGAQGTLHVFRQPCAVNWGNVCGAHPRQVWLGYNADSAQSFTPIINLSAGLRAKGWQRQMITDVNCYGNGGGWVRAVSAPYYDGEVSARVKTPTCPAGTLVQKIRSWRVPVNYTPTCVPGATLCWHANAKVFEFTAPQTWIDGTVPYAVCVIGGTDCGTPVQQQAACSWGGIAVDVGFCDPAKQASTGLAGTTAMPRETDLAAPAPYSPGQPSNTGVVADPNPGTTTGGGGNGTTVNVPIDPGTGQNTTTPSDGGDSPCTPSGWGWMNPVEWVLKPVKCAMVWAFVPDSETVQDAWDGLMADAEQNVPVAWVYKSHELLSESAAGASAAVAANANGCVQVMPDDPELGGNGSGFCPSTMSLGSVGQARPWLGYAVWLFWGWSMYGVLFRRPAASTEPEQLSLF